jgi:phosphoglycerate kinase
VDGIVKKAAEKNVKLHFPLDFIVADKFAPDATSKSAEASGGIEDGWMGLDAGPKTRKAMTEVVMRAKTIVWNGPVGKLQLRKQDCVS